MKFLIKYYLTAPFDRNDAQKLIRNAGFVYRRISDLTKLSNDNFTHNLLFDEN